MSQTEDLLGLVNEFPQAFADPEHLPPLSRAQRVLSLADVNATAAAKTQQLLQLIAEFPQAFADPEAPSISQSEKLSPLPAHSPATSELAESVTAQSPSGVVDSPIHGLPADYDYALRRRVPTLNWGQIDFNLVYGESDLREIWVTVGKSGTEVQSLCEAIARLVNLLLANHVAVPKIVREIRGIRGADSEGLGPQRILGLADLMGKVLQEAPERTPSQLKLSGERELTSQPWDDPQQAVPNLHESEPSEEANSPGLAPDLSMNSNAIDSYNAALSLTPEALTTDIWLEIGSNSSTASLCPECGSELQQINGCSGGACSVCGYSSCS